MLSVKGLFTEYPNERGELVKAAQDASSAAATAVAPEFPLAQWRSSWQMHDIDGGHIHEMTVDEKGALVEFIWRVDNVELTTVGIDIGSSTSHLIFSKVRLQRKTQLLSSQFVVVERKTLWCSPIMFTPFLPDNTIDAAQLGLFIADAYRQAGLTPADIDSGAVILTGEAIKRTNAQAVAELFAADSGKFVCASAGHHLESVLAAHGSGAVALSRANSSAVMNVDIGGTTKLALIVNGEIVGTCALAVGGRLLAYDSEGRIVRMDSAARRVAKALGLRFALGERPDAEDLDRLVAALCAAAVSLIRQDQATGLAKELLLTDPLPAVGVVPDVVSFSGGVSEYIYGREHQLFGDIAKPLAEKIAAVVAAGRIAARVLDPGQGIRATVIGAAQFSLQLSGKTIHISPGVQLPVRNVPVVLPQLALDAAITPGSVAAAIAAALDRCDLLAGEPAALALRWSGDPDYPRLRALAEGIALALEYEEVVYAHISEMPVGSYKKADRHAADYHVMCVIGTGYSLLWYGDQDMHRVDWKHGTVFAPPDQMFHQHFNTSVTPARYLATAFGSLRYPFTESKRRSNQGRCGPASSKAATRSSTRTSRRAFSSCSKKR